MVGCCVFGAFILGGSCASSGLSCAPLWASLAFVRPLLQFGARDPLRSISPIRGEKQLHPAFYIRNAQLLLRVWICWVPFAAVMVDSGQSRPRHSTQEGLIAFVWCGESSVTHLAAICEPLRRLVEEHKWKD